MHAALATTFRNLFIGERNAYSRSGATLILNSKPGISLSLSFSLTKKKANSISSKGTVHSRNYMQARIIPSHLISISSNLFLRLRVVLLRLLRSLLLQFVDVLVVVVDVLLVGSNVRL